MAASQTAIDFIRDREGFSPTAKWDNQQYSIGYGTKATADEIKDGTPISRSDAEARLATEANKAADYVDKLNPNLPGGHRDAFTSAAYNLGSFGSGLSGAISSGDLQGSLNKLALYTGSNNPADKEGLTNRRNAEIALAGGTSAPAVQTASAVPPIPQPRPQNPMQVAANQWANPRLPVLPTLPGSPQPSTPMPPAGNALALAATPVASPAAAAIQNVALAPQATISGLQPGGIALSSDGASPLQKVQFNANSPVESTTVPKGPYEIENIIKAAMKGDEGALRWATMVSSLQAGMAGGEPVAKPLLEKYFADLAASSPGAIRAVETALGKNPGLTKAIAGPLGDALLPMLPEAFRQLPLTQVPNPNLRPQTGGVLPPPTGAALAYAPPATGGALPAPNALKQQAADYLKKFSWTSPGLVNSTSRYWEANPDLAPKGVASNPQAPSVSTPLPPPAQPATEFPQQTFGSNNGYLTGTQDEGVGGGQSTSSYWAPAPQQPAAPSSTTYYTASGAPVSIPSNNSTYAASTGFGTVPSNALSGVSNRASGSVGSNNTYLSGQGQSASPLGWTSPQAPVGSGAGLTAAQNAFSSPYGWTSSASNALSQAVAMAPVKPQATASSWTPWKSTTSVPATVPGANVNRPGVATTSKAGPTPQSVAPQPAATPRATAQSYAQSDPNWANMNSSQQTNATNSYLNWNGPEQTSDPYAAGWFPEDYQDLPDLDANSTNIFGT